MAMIAPVAVLCVVLPLDVVATWMAMRSCASTSAQKTAQLILIWVVPCIGAIMTIAVQSEFKDRPRGRFGGGSNGEYPLSGADLYARSPPGDPWGADHGNPGTGGGHGGDGGH